MAYTKKALDGPRKPRPRRAPRLPVDHPPVDLLRQAGATDAVLAEVYREWNNLDPDERMATAESLRNLTTGERHAAVVVTECMLASGDGLEADVLDEAARLTEAVPDLPVRDTLQWAANHDTPGAVAALVVELRKPAEDRRKTLVEGLRAQLGG